MKYTKISKAMPKAVLGFSMALLALSCAKEQKVESVAHNGPDSPGYQVDVRPITLDWYVNFD